jgi:hypothetical protein
MLAPSIMSVITLMVEAASISEMYVNFYQNTQSNNPEDNHLHTRQKSHNRLWV